MKKILKSALLLLGGVCLFAACSDDNDSNPTLPTVESFVLNQPVFSGGTVDVAATDALPFTWSQPDYGFPAAMQYFLQFSKDGEFTTSVAEADADESGALVPNYIEFETGYTTPQASISGTDFARLLQRVCRFTEGAVPATQTVYARVLSYIKGAANVDSLYSNIIAFNVIPHYVELQDAAPIIWYLVGNCIADGSWGNSADGVGTNLIPLYPKAGEEYDKVTGTGVITYTGYFPAGGQFKFVLNPGSWDTQMNFENIDKEKTTAAITDEDGDNHNIGITNAGVYTISVDTKTEQVTIEAHDGTPAVFTEMYIAGSFTENWDATPVTPVSTADGVENHDWYYDLDATAGNLEVKFLADTGWATNWGDTGFPYGFGTQNGANIPVAAGNYRVIFNDITGSYIFIEK